MPTGAGVVIDTVLTVDPTSEHVSTPGSDGDSSLATDLVDADLAATEPDEASLVVSGPAPATG